MHPDDTRHSKQDHLLMWPSIAKPTILLQYILVPNLGCETRGCTLRLLLTKFIFCPWSIVWEDTFLCIKICFVHCYSYFAKKSAMHVAIHVVKPLKSRHTGGSTIIRCMYRGCSHLESWLAGHALDLELLNRFMQRGVAYKKSNQQTMNAKGLIVLVLVVFTSVGSALTDYLV